MTMDRRSFLRGMAGILAAGAAPAIIMTPGLLMPVKTLWTPRGLYDVVVPISRGWTFRNGGMGDVIVSAIWEEGSSQEIVPPLIVPSGESVDFKVCPNKAIISQFDGLYGMSMHLGTVECFPMAAPLKRIA